MNVSPESLIRNSLWREVWLGSSLGTTLRNATKAKRSSQGFIGQAERTRGTK